MFVCGFLFDPTGTRVALIKKARPDWQKGKLNGVGGHIEKGESAIGAMMREFHEETLTLIETSRWVPFVRFIDARDYVVTFFTALGTEEEMIAVARHGHVNDDEEPVYVVPIDYVLGGSLDSSLPYTFDRVRGKDMAWPYVGSDPISNLHWLIPMAREVVFHRGSLPEYVIFEKENKI